MIGFLFSMRFLRCLALTPAALPSAAALVFFFLPQLASAQAPATTGGGPGTGAPAANGPAPGVSAGTPKPTPNRPLTLSDVVAIAVGGNSGLVIAQQRLEEAQELIVQVNAQGRPQFSADAVDTYSTYRAFAPTLTNPVITNPTLPGGGQIPQVVDSGTGFSTAFIGGGGGGNAPSTGASSSVGLSASPFSSVSPGGTSSGVSAPGANAPGVSSPGVGAPSSTGSPTVGSPTLTTPAPTVTTPAPTTTAPAAPAPAAPSNAAPGTAAPGGTAAPAAGASASALQALPPIVEDYAAAPLAGADRPAQVAEAAPPKPRDTSTGTGTGTGTASTPGIAGGTSGQINNAAARVSVAQYLDLFGLLSAARGVQNDVRDFYSLDIERLRNETALAAKNLFFNVLLTQSVVDTEQEQVRYAQENVRITEERLRQGIVSRFDVLTAETALSTAQQQLISAQDNLELSEANLAYLLGTDPDQPLLLETPPLPPLTQTVNLKQSTQTALARRPEVRQADANVEESRRLVRLAGSTLLPTVSLIATGEQTTTASITAPKSFGTISAQVSVPFDDGGATRSRERSARIDVQTQILTLEELKLNVSLEVRQATLNIRNAQAQVGAAQVGVTQAQESVRLAYLRYQGGLGTFLDVLNALAELAATRNNLSSAQYFYQISLAQLVRALGGR